MIELLKVKGIRVNQQVPEHGGTPLHGISSLVTLKKNPNMVTIPSNIVVAASFVGNGEITAMLLSSGADTEIKNNLGLTAFQDATGDSREAYRILKEGGMDALWKKWPRIKLIDQHSLGPRGRENFNFLGMKQNLE